MFFRTIEVDGVTYLLIVENEDSGKYLRQRLICELGRIKGLKAAGAVDRMLISLARFSDTFVLMSANNRAVEIETTCAS